jgi:propionyl-CoA synthetase
MSYEDVYRRSIEDPEAHWLQAAGDVVWTTPPTAALGDDGSWFPGGTLNTAYNALDRHVEAGRGDVPALVYDSPVTDSLRRWTYREARDEVARVAGGLRRLGVDSGDRVLIYMPMVPEAVFAMLACARIGAIHSVVFGGFAARELAIRIDDARPLVVVSASCGIERSRVIPYGPLLREALDLAAHAPEHVVVLERPEEPGAIADGELTWDELVEGAEPAACVAVASADPLYVLYTSGTTGKPKGVVRDTGGHAVALTWSMANVYAARAGDVFWAASDIGWVVGHSYIVYGPLLAGATTVLYEGKPLGTPDAGAFWRVVEEHRVDILFTAPTALRAIKKEDPDGHLRRGRDLSSLRALFLAGERTDPDSLAWASKLLAVPVVDHWWQTETGWPIAGNPLGIERLPARPGSAGKPMPGFVVDVLDDSGMPLDARAHGAIALRLPLPPGCLLGLWEDEVGYRSAYLQRFPGHYASGDGGYRDEDGYLYVMGRTDDVINVAGHRLSTGAIEEVVAEHPEVAECAVVGAGDELKGQQPVAFVVVKAGSDRPPDEIAAEIRQRVRSRIGAIASLRDVHVVRQLPKTRSGKVVRATIRAIVDERPYVVPATIEDAAALEEIDAAARSIRERR